MSIAVKSLVGTALWIGVILFAAAPFALSGVMLAFGEYGLAGIAFGLGLILALVLAALSASSRRMRSPSASPLQTG